MPRQTIARAGHLLERCAGRADVGERHLDRVLDRVQQLDDHVRHVAERQLPALVGPRARPGARLPDRVPHLQRVKQERLFAIQSSSPQSSLPSKQGRDRERNTQADAVSKLSQSDAIQSDEEKKQAEQALKSFQTHSPCADEPAG